MSARAFVGVGRLAGATRAYLVKPRQRRGGVVGPRRALVLMLAVAAVAVVTLMARAFGGRVLKRVALVALARFRALPFGPLLAGRVRPIVHPRDGLADQLLDRRDVSAIGGRHDGDGGAAASRAPRAADAMDVIVGVVRDVEVEDVADRGNVEAARGHVRGNQQRDF